MRDGVAMMVYTHWGIGPSATENLLRSFARRERQTPRSTLCKIAKGRDVT